MSARLVAEATEESHHGKIIIISRRDDDDDDDGGGRAETRRRKRSRADAPWRPLVDVPVPRGRPHDRRPRRGRDLTRGATTAPFSFDAFPFRFGTSESGPLGRADSCTKNGPGGMI